MKQPTMTFVKVLFAVQCIGASTVAPALDAPRNLRFGTPIPGGNAGQGGATGWQHTGVTLKSCESYSNGTDYVLDGRKTALTVDSCDFSGRVIRIYGNVTLKRSRVIGSNGVDCAGPAIAVEDGAGPVLIEDVEITTSNPNAVGGAARQDRTICVWKGNTQPVTIRRIWTHDTMRGLDFTNQTNVTVLDSYLGPNVSPPTGQPVGSCLNDNERAHASAMRVAGGVSNLRLTNNVFRIGACSRASGIIATYPEQGHNHDIIVDGGRWIIEGNNSGAYGIAAGTPDTSTGYTNYDFHIQNVQISTEYNSSGCPSGCAQNWNQIARDGISTWTNIRKYNPGKADDGQIISP